MAKRKAKTPKTPATPSDVHPILLELDANRDDWTLWGVFADWHEDYGTDHAECVRWLANAHKRPDTVTRPKDQKPTGEGAWFNADGVAGKGLGDPESDLPEVLYKYLQGGDEVASHKKYPTWIEAVQAVFTAFLLARADGWVPVVEANGGEADEPETDEPTIVEG